MKILIWEFKHYNMEQKEQKPYMANAIGFSAFMLALAFMVKSCSNMAIEVQKTEQLKVKQQTNSTK